MTAHGFKQKERGATEAAKKAQGALASIGPGEFSWGLVEEWAESIKKDKLLNARIFGSEKSSLIGLAAQAADCRGVRELLALGADPNMLNGSRKMSPIAMAVEMAVGFSPELQMCLEALFAAGADVDAANGTGIRPMHRAAGAGNVEAARWLLSKGADPSGEDKRGMAPLHFAANSNSGAMAAMLIAAGARLYPDNTASAGADPLELAMSYRDQSVAQIIEQARRVSVEKAEVQASSGAPMAAERPRPRL